MSTLTRLTTYAALAIVSRGVFRATFGDTDWASALGILLGIWVGRVLVGLWDARSEKARNEKAQRLSHQLYNLDEGSKNYSVVYRHGHKGIDHYLRMYLKRSTLPGTLVLSRSRLRFVCRSTRTEQKFTLEWSQVQDAEYINIAGWLSNTPGLRVRNEKYPPITLASQEAVEIVAGARARRRHCEEKLAERRRLEEEQIRSRNLDAISPARFERLVGQLFRSMGYQVKHTGGSGDRGIDLSCWRPDAESSEVIVQCKRYKGKVDVRTIRAFYGVLVDCSAELGYVVTTGEFTEPATSWAADKPIELIDRYDLARLLDEHLSSAGAPPNGLHQMKLFD